MKRLLETLLPIVILLLVSTTLRAQYIAPDTGNGVVYFSYDVPDSVNAEGPPDQHYTDISSGGLVILDIGFRRTLTGPWLPILPNSVLTIYAARGKANDSEAVAVQFIKYDASGATEYLSGFYYATPGITRITVPDSEYTVVEFSPTGAGTSTGSRSFLLDAVMLRQNFSTLSVEEGSAQLSSGLIANYPNPFTASGRSVMRFSVAEPATASIVLFDAIGRQIDRIEMGRLAAGVYNQEFHVSAPGVYFARLLVNGTPLGKALKMTSLR